MITSRLLAIIAFVLSLINICVWFYCIFLIRKNKQLSKRLDLIVPFSTKEDVKAGTTHIFTMPKHLLKHLIKNQPIHIKPMRDYKQESEDMGYTIDEDELLKEHIIKTKSKAT